MVLTKVFLKLHFVLASVRSLVFALAVFNNRIVWVVSIENLNRIT